MFISDNPAYLPKPNAEFPKPNTSADGAIVCRRRRLAAGPPTSAAGTFATLEPEVTAGAVFNSNSHRRYLSSTAPSGVISFSGVDEDVFSPALFVVLLHWRHCNINLQMLKVGLGWNWVPVSKDEPCSLVVLPEKSERKSRNKRRFLLSTIFPHHKPSRHPFPIQTCKITRMPSLPSPLTIFIPPSFAAGTVSIPEPEVICRTITATASHHWYLHLPPETSTCQLAVAIVLPSVAGTVNLPSVWFSILQNFFYWKKYFV